MYEYDLTIANYGSEGISGLDILNANGLFGLNDFSVVNAPQNIGGNPAASWGFFTPNAAAPPPQDLSFFSFVPAGDAAPHEMLGGFSFDTMTAPGSFDPASFLVDTVPSSGGPNSPPQMARVPEPAGLTLGIIAAVVVAGLCRRSGRRISPVSC